MASQYTTLITRQNGTIVVVDVASSVPEISLTVYDESPGSSTLVQANTWALMPVGAPTTNCDMVANTGFPGVYEMNSVGEAALLALLKPGGVYRFVWRWIYRGVTMEESKRITWDSPVPAGMAALRAGIPPIQFSPTVEGVAVDPDQVTLSGTSYYRGSLSFANLTVTSAATIASWSGSTSTPTPAAWSAVTSYLSSQVATVAGTTYVCMTDSINKTPVAAAWNIATPYVVGEFVTYAGSTYECIANSTGNQPDTSTTYWTELWRALTTTLVNGSSIPLYQTRQIVQGRYAIGDADSATMLAGLVHGNKYRATWSFVYNGVEYTTSSDFVYQAAGKKKVTEVNNYTLTFANIKKRVIDYLGSEPGTMTINDLVNEATLAFYQEAAFVFPEADTIYLDQWSGKDHLELPEDYGGIRILMRANDPIHNCKRVTLPQMASLRERNWTGSTNITFFCVKVQQPRDAADEIKRRIDIFPTPSTTVPNAYRLDYLRVPPVMVNDADVPPIPKSLLPAYAQFLRAYASEVEQEGEAREERRKFDMILGRAAKHDDQQSDNFVGHMNPHACIGRDLDDNSYLPLNPDQGPDYT